MERFSEKVKELIRSLQRSRRRKQLLLAAGAVVVFVTTYALILPAITMDQESASEEIGFFYETEEEPETAEDAWDVPEEPAEMYADDDPDEPAAEAYVPEAEDPDEYLSDDPWEEEPYRTEDEEPDEVREEQMLFLEEEEVLEEAAAAAYTGTDLTSYLKSAEVMKIAGGVWTKATEFDAGDQIRVILDYQIDYGVLSNDNPPVSRTMTYSLPNGVVPKQVYSGPIHVGGAAAGTYYIQTDGTIALVFDEDFVRSLSASVDGDIRFDGTLSEDAGGSEGVVHFGGSTSPITVRKQEETTTDIRTVKEGSWKNVSNGRAEAGYKITVSTTKGTEDTVTIRDQLDGQSQLTGLNNISYSQIQVWKVEANGSRQQVHAAVTPQNPTQNFEISSLPKLAAGERYEVEYNISADIVEGAESYRLGNSAAGESGKQNNGDRKDLSWQKQVQKSGSYDQDTGLITWTVTVNPNEQDVSGWNVSDQLPEDLVGTITVQGGSGGYWTTIEAQGRNLSWSFPYDLNENQKKDRYTITYKTRAPAGTGNTTVENTASVTGTGVNAQDTAAVGVTRRDWGVSKGRTGGGVTGNSSIYKEEWSAAVTIPETGFTSFTYTDEIKNAVDAEGHDQGPDSHYARASELEAHFRTGELYIDVDGETSYRLGADGALHVSGSGAATDAATVVIRCFDQNGAEILPDGEGWNTAHVKSFTVTVTAKEGTTLQARRLHLNRYATYMETTEDAAGETWTVKNKGSIPDHEKEADHKTEIPHKIRKQVDTGQQAPNRWSSESWRLGYDQLETADGRHILNYRLLLTTDASTPETITVTDLIPEGTRFVEGSLDGAFYESEYSEQMNNQAGVNFSDPTWKAAHLSASAEEGEDGASALRITLTDYHFGNYPTLKLTYSLEIDDERWEDLKTASLTYSNTAVWDGSRSSVDTSVRRDVDNLYKGGEQLKDENGQWTGRLRYYVTINPLGKDLNPNADVLTLTDKLSQEALNYGATLDVSATKLCAFDSGAENNAGAELERALYSMSYDAAAGSLTVNIPDELPSVLVYEYKLDESYQNAVNLTISNDASLNGRWGTSQKLRLETNSSGATVKTRSITLYKVDSENYTKRLPGAVFRFEKYVQSGGSWGWQTIDESLTTCAEPSEAHYGGLYWDQLKPDTPIAENVLYRLTETQAPDGYQKSAESFLFIYLDENNSEDAAYNTSRAGDIVGAMNGDGWKKVSKFRHTGALISYITNDYVEVGVKKSWTDSSGNTLSGDEIPEGPVRVQLLQGKSVIDGYRITVRYIEQDGKEHPAEEFYVGRQSALKISVLKYNQEDILSPEVVTNGTAYAMTHREGDPELMLSYDLEQVTEDLDLIVRQTDTTNFRSYTVSGYNPPGTSLAEAVAYGAPVELTAGEQWSYIWQNLPAQDADGTDYYYSVRELNIPEDFNVSYINNQGIRHGQITVSNIKTDETHPKKEYTALKATKSWVDEAGQSTAMDGYTVTFAVERTAGGMSEAERYPLSAGQVTGDTAGGCTVNSDGTVTLTYRGESWPVITVSDLPKNRDQEDGGGSWSYSIRETAHTPSSAAFNSVDYVKTADEATGLELTTVVNRAEEPFTGIRVAKKWTTRSGAPLTGGLPESVQAQLQITTTPGEENSWQTVSDGSTWGRTETYTVSAEISCQTPGVTRTATYTVAAGGSLKLSAEWRSFKITLSDGSELQSAQDPSQNYQHTCVIGPVVQDMTITVREDTNSDNIMVPTQLSDPGAPPISEGETIEKGLVTLTAENGWRYTWEQLPAADGTGQKYYYRVLEQPVGGYTTTYSNNTGITEGLITIINSRDREEGFELPQTGGSGTSRYIGAGWFLVLAGLLLLYIKKHLQRSRN